jgi:hypothetical protein
MTRRPRSKRAAALAASAPAVFLPASSHSCAAGQWVVKDTRILAQGVLDNAEDFTPEEIASEIYEGLGADRARRIVEYAGSPCAILGPRSRRRQR